MVKNNIYCEKQRGDLCRLHSINNYFGYEKYSEKEFYRFCDAYDKLIIGLNSRNMDGFAEGRSIISYIMDINKIFVLLIPINSYSGSRAHLDMERYSRFLNNIESCFEFNKSHIWINKKLDGIWYKIDSISGINSIDKPNFHNNETGFFLVVENINLFIEIEHYIRKIRKIIFPKNLENPENLEDIEIHLYSLYFCLKHISINSSINSSIESSKTLLINLRNTLKIYIELKREISSPNTITNTINKLKKINIKIINLLKLLVF